MDIFIKKVACLCFLMVFLVLPVSKGWASSDEGHWADLGGVRFDESVDFKDFTLASVDGKEIVLSSLKGKVVVLNFWASWCPACREEMPSMERLYNEYKNKGLVIVGIDFMERPGVVEKYLKKTGLTFPILLDKYGKVADQFNAKLIPTTYIIDKKGKAIGKVIGGRDWDGEHVRAIIEWLLFSK